MKTLALVGVAPCIALLAVGPAHSLTVRVDPSGGAPRLLVNGKPVRARMFWGAPGGAPLSIGPEGREHSFEFTPTEGEAARATMHFRFGQTPGDIFLDDIRVTDLDADRDVIPLRDFESGPASFTDGWTFWPTGEANTVGTVTVEEGVGRDGSAGLHVRLSAPTGGQWPDFHIYHHANLSLVKDHRHRVTFWARSEPGRDLTVAFYRPGATYTYLGGPPGFFESQIKLAADVGVDFVSFPLPLPWPAPAQDADWAPVDAACERVLAANPRALLLPRIGMAPPHWWLEAHPDDRMVWEDGAHKQGFVVASPEYRRDAAERLAALVTHVEGAFPDHIAGYHPCGQNTGEWFYHDSWGRTLNGYSPGSLKAWRRWLAQRYQTDGALREAWGDANVTLETAPVPTPEARHAAPAGVLRDPTGERPVIDFDEFQQQMMAECVCDLARAARTASGGRKLVVFFYGYVFEFGALPTSPAASGHYGLRRVLDSPDIDVLCSPISYFDRGLGQSAPAMTAAESVALAGKMWLYEDDTATYLSTGTPPGSRERVKTLEETNAQLVRNVAQEALRNFGTWWMDLTRTGWFNDPGMWAEMERLKALDDALLAEPTPFRPAVAAVIDERSMLRVAGGGVVVTRPGIYEARRPLARMGAPYGQYLLDDVLDGKVDAEVLVFLNAWCLSPDQREKLLAVTRGKARVWCSAPGYHDNWQTSTEAMQQLTGFRLEPVSPEKAVVTPAERGRESGLAEPFGVDRPITPLFAAADAAPEEILATYPDGSAAIAARRGEGGLSVFVGVPGLSSELLRSVAREAGVHLFTQSDCNVYANGPFLALHASEDGPIEIDTGKPGPITDVLTRQPVGQGPRLSLPLKFGETRVLKY
jgi:beta-galactosidase